MQLRFSLFAQEFFDFAVKGKKAQMGMAHEAVGKSDVIEGFDYVLIGSSVVMKNSDWIYILTGDLNFYDRDILEKSIHILKLKGEL